MNKDEIIIYQSDDQMVRLDVRLDEETVWLNIEQISILFGRDRTVINRHINNIFNEGELEKEVVCAFFALTTQHGAIKGKTQTKNVEFFNLDVIISVGYRVKSKQGTQFRIWANKILKDYLLKGYAVNQRFERIESDVHDLRRKVNEFDLQIKTHLPANEGIFFEGQIYDAYKFVSDLIKTAKTSIVLIDNYVDDSVLTILLKRNTGVKAIIFTSNISKQMHLDIQKHNQQYPEIEIYEFKKSHDRFLIMDNQTIYHIGASLKDLGKKWFAFSRFEIDPNLLLNNLS